MRASVIINNYNYGRYLRHAIDSALNQTWKNIEVIVVDDGSTDNSRHIIAEYGNRVKAVFKENGGQCSAVNAGFSHCTGGVILMLDSDDYLKPNAAELHILCFENPSTVKSCGYLEVVNESGDILGKRVPNKFVKSGDYREATLQNGVDIYDVSFTSGHAWSRKFLEQVMPLPEKDLIGIDGYLTAIDRLFGNIEFIEEVVGYYRRHGSNIGPMEYQFTSSYLEKRIACRNYRLEFLSLWASRLGYSVDPLKIGQIKSWKTLLMRHVICLMNKEPTTVDFKELVTAPLRNHRRPLWRACLLSLTLGTIRIVPSKPALYFAAKLLGRRGFRYGHQVSDVS